MADILTVDDQQFMLRIVSRQLEQAGHTVRTATNGEDALAMLAESVPDLMFCDIGMAGMDGFETLSRIRANPAWDHMPVVMLTAHGQAKDWERAQALGANDYLTKPFSTAQLIEVVNHMLGEDKP